MSEPSRPPALQVAGLNAFYRKSQVVFGVDLVVGRGETVAVLGRNGAGKTSTIMAVAGLVRTRDSSIVLDGREIGHMPPYRRVRTGLSVVPSGARAFPTLTVQQNLEMVKRRDGGDGGWTIADVYEAFPKLERLRRSRGGQLSGGERQMLAVGRAMLANPIVLMLDEPSEGLAPLVVREIGHMLRDLNRHGLAVVLTEQNHHLALETADRAYFLEKGEVTWHGDASDARQPDVIDRFLAV
jgi:branched-chain amino acid transport system ATP-binding protein